ncbi:GNAT family N-acetyltransferase [Kribbella sandramycini]|uniref:GNAT family N-acetyltransferase n=1 Tax=Kribbella sandramycini TaxID=60450 RepID=A0A7Y4KY57_9ACTN|nr:GNAT family N-acetyltransferase [Kribbella sandramycini]MBB6569332.1 ribosomal protein S18 acetylase RimI-like enzyme [Kribbella sandramycini]NOL40829.1 GNAT family N-acetyltransferase [Kribbella sandramycini]
MLIRAATADDLEFLTAMLLEAYNWDGTATFTIEGLRADEHAAPYLAGWPRVDDFGVIAEVDGVPAGAAWARLIPGGYGFVADDVPELSLGVSPDFRRRGIARALLTELLEAARAASYERLSLSVDPANPAAGLYRSLGFGKVGVAGTSDTMVVEL